MTSAEQFLSGGGAKSAKWPNVGDVISGSIVSEPEVKQVTNYEDGKPKFWDNGEPQLQLVVILQTDQADGAEDDGKRAVYVKGQLRKATQDAVRAAGAKTLAVGGTLTVRHTGLGEKKGKLSPPKLYEVTYTAPSTGGSSTDFLADDKEEDKAAPNPALEAALAALTPEQRAQLLAGK